MNEGTRTGVLATALALSLIFNVFYIVGNWQARQEAEVAPSNAAPAEDDAANVDEPVETDRAERERRMADRIAERLGLSDEQRANFLELRMLIIEEEQTFDAAMREVRAEIDTVLLSDDADESEVMELRRRHDDLRRQRQSATHRYFESFVQTLDEAQRKEFFEMARSWRRDELRRRFDRDHDGQLDADEERKFQEACDRMRRGGQRGRRGDGRGDGGPPPKRDGGPEGQRGPDGPGGPWDRGDRGMPRYDDHDRSSDRESDELDAPVENPVLDPAEQASGTIFNA